MALVLRFARQAARAHACKHLFPLHLVLPRTGVTGFLYEPSDVGRAAELIGQLTKDQDLRCGKG